MKILGLLEDLLLVVEEFAEVLGVLLDMMIELDEMLDELTKVVVPIVGTEWKLVGELEELNKVVLGL